MKLKTYNHFRSIGDMKVNYTLLRFQDTGSATGET